MKIAIVLSTLFSILPLYLSLKGRWRTGILLGLALSLVALVAGYYAGEEKIGLLSSIVFFALAVFPIPIRAEVREIRKEYKDKQKTLKSKTHEFKIEFEQWVENKTRLIEEMDQIYNRYALAKGLVSYVEGRSVLQELGTFFSAKKNVVGLSFFKLMFKDDSLSSDEDIAKSFEVHSDVWLNQYASGWVSETDWRKILAEISVTKDSVAEPFVIGPFKVRFPTILLERRDPVTTGNPLARNEAYVLVGVPVKWDGKVRGVLMFLLSNELPEHFLEEVSIYAQLLGLALHKISLYQLMIERGRRDGLTNLYLRRVLLERLHEEINFTKRYGYSFSLLLMDLDNFKAVNDTYGHTAGDRVLRNIASCIRNTLHSGVTISRYGGEEFAILIGLAPQDEVMRISEQIRIAVASLETTISDDVKVRITVSIGVAHYLPDSPPFKDFIERADTALYWAKNRGKNRVCEWRNDPAQSPNPVPERSNSPE